jgi:hypothetical protein
VLLLLLLLQVVEWLQLLAERGTESAGFKSTGFERFERVWTGQQVSSQLLLEKHLYAIPASMLLCWRLSTAAKTLGLHAALMQPLQ